MGRKAAKTNRSGQTSRAAARLEFRSAYGFVSRSHSTLSDLILRSFIQT